MYGKGTASAVPQNAVEELALASEVEFSSAAEASIQGKSIGTAKSRALPVRALFVEYLSSKT